MTLYPVSTVCHKTYDEINVPISPLAVIKTEGKNSMVFVKDHRDDYEEYAGSTDDEDYSVPR